MDCEYMEEDVEEDEEEDVDIHELEYTNGSNEVFKIFNQKCFMCFEQESDYFFKQCGHQCEECESIVRNVNKIKLILIY